MADSRNILVFLIVFWGLLTLTSYVFSDYLQKEPLLLSDIRCLNYRNDQTCPHITDDNQESFKGIINNLLSDIFNIAEDIPLINVFVPLAKILTFQYNSYIPGFLTIILDVLAILTIISIVDFFRGT